MLTNIDSCNFEKIMLLIMDRDGVIIANEIIPEEKNHCQSLSRLLNGLPNEMRSKFCTDQIYGDTTFYLMALTYAELGFFVYGRQSAVETDLDVSRGIFLPTRLSQQQFEQFGKILFHPTIRKIENLHISHLFGHEMEELYRSPYSFLDQETARAVLNCVVGTVEREKGPRR